MNEILLGDSVEVLKNVEAKSIQTCITSPPYFGLRDYGMEGQIGLEQTPELYVARLVELFREVRRTLRDDGTLWLNLGDSYVHTGPSGWQGKNGKRADRRFTANGAYPKAPNLKPKDLIGIPWRVAFALQADGWYLRQDIIWNKPNPMPESVMDRCTKSHEYIFFLSKKSKYYYDADAIKEPAIYGSIDRIERQEWENKAIPTSIRNGLRPRDKRAGKGRIAYEGKRSNGTASEAGIKASGQQAFVSIPEYRNKRDVWTVSTRPYLDAHFATFPEVLVEPMVMAGAPTGGVVLDPFMGAGTTAVVAKRLGRNYMGVELNPDYKRLAEERIAGVTSPLF